MGRRRCRRRTDRRWRARRDRARETPSYLAHSRSVISLTAARDSSLRPVSSANASSMPRVDRPRAQSSTASRSSSRVRPERRRRPRRKGLGRVANLRRRIFDRPVRRLHLARPIAVAAAGLPALAALAALAPQDVGDLAFERLLDNQPQRQADQVAAARRRPRSPFLRARSSSRVRSGADDLSIGMLPGANGANRKPAPASLQAGCVPTPFSSKPAPSPSNRSHLPSAVAARSSLRIEKRPNVPAIDTVANVVSSRYSADSIVARPRMGFYARNTARRRSQNYRPRRRQRSAPHGDRATARVGKVDRRRGACGHSQSRRTAFRRGCSDGRISLRRSRAHRERPQGERRPAAMCWRSTRGSGRPISSPRLWLLTIMKRVS